MREIAREIQIQKCRILTRIIFGSPLAEYKCEMVVETHRGKFGRYLHERHRGRLLEILRESDCRTPHAIAVDAIDLCVALPQLANACVRQPVTSFRDVLDDAARYAQEVVAKEETEKEEEEDDCDVDCNDVCDDDRARKQRIGGECGGDKRAKKHPARRVKHAVRVRVNFERFSR